jgi:hypothetical protein
MHYQDARHAFACCSAPATTGSFRSHADAFTMTLRLRRKSIISDDAFRALRYVFDRLNEQFACQFPIPMTRTELEAENAYLRAALKQAGIDMDDAGTRQASFENRYRAFIESAVDWAIIVTDLEGRDHVGQIAGRFRASRRDGADVGRGAALGSGPYAARIRKLVKASCTKHPLRQRRNLRRYPPRCAQLRRG